MLDSDIDSILRVANMSMQQAKRVANSVAEAYNHYPDLEGNITRLVDIVQDGFDADANTSARVDEMSTFMCGQPNQFIIDNYNIKDLFKTDDDDGSSGGGDDSGGDGKAKTKAIFREAVNMNLEPFEKVRT